MLTRLLLFVFVLLTHVCFSQNFSNKGKEFWISYGNHVEMFDVMDTITPGKTEQMQLYMTSDVSTTGMVEIKGIGLQVPFTVTANKITTIDIPRQAALLSEGVYDLGIHVTAEDPIVVYSFIYFNRVSGATLCLPVSTLGKEYYSVNYTQVSNQDDSYSYFDVIAADTGVTRVEIIPSQMTKDGHAAGVPYYVDLNQGEVYQVLGAKKPAVIYNPGTDYSDTAYLGTDLTGSYIRSINSANVKCKKIAVFCGSGKISIGCSGTGSSDNLYQQMYPVTTWGKSYVTLPNVNKGNAEDHHNYYRIFKVNPSATVKLNGAVIPSGSFVNGQYYEFSNGTPNFIEADKPVLVAQYFPTSFCRYGVHTGNGDPEMIYLNPLEQTIASVTLNSIAPQNLNSNINDHYINVILKNIPRVINSFKIDGVQAGNFVPHPANDKYAYAQIRVDQWGHTLTCDSGFNAIAYGYGSLESYGYSAGTNLRDLYQFVSIENDYASENFPSGCKNSPFRFSINLPYKADKIQWFFKGLFKDTVILSPVADSSWIVDDRILYRYQLDKTFVIREVGTYPIKVVANNPVSDGCSGEQIIDYDLQVFDRHKAGFTASGDGCLNAPVSFTDTSQADGREIIRRIWDFGDGSGSGLQAPQHRYGNAGSYTVKMANISEIGCISDTATVLVKLSPSPDPSFVRIDSACENLAVRFDANAEKMAGWTWDFGDGTTAMDENPVHSFTTTGIYQVSLLVEDSSGCRDSIRIPVRVHSTPLAGFTLPQACSITTAQFFDASQIADGSESQFRYRWSFGDNQASPQNPNVSTEKNPVHNYATVGVYDVTLAVTSKDGCTADTTRQYSHYPSLPAAAFALELPSRACGDTDVVLINRSTIATGTITRLEIYWDEKSDTLLKTVDLSPAEGKSYAFKYPGGSAEPRRFEILLKVYSGPECMQLHRETITISPTLRLEFDPLAAVCEEDAPYQISGVREVTGVPGTGVFSGPGVTPSGIFDPGLARAGVHTLRYSYKGANGCSAYVEQAIHVVAPPFADAGPDIMVEAGKSASLQGKGAANCVYSWSPNTSIDNHGVLNPTVSPVTDVTYYLKVMSTEGCSSVDSVAVRIRKEITVPNAFSPNGDGINDTWKIPQLAFYHDAVLQVFNRHGQLVFHSSGYSKEWDGTYKGSFLPAGTYYFVIRLQGKKPMSGPVTIIR